MAVDVLLLALLGIFGSGDAGTTAFPLLKVPVGPRACAMGEAFTGLADDVSSMFWNPAGTAQLDKTQLGFSHQEWFAGTRDENVAAAIPVGPGFLGVGAVYSATGGIEIWNQRNRQEGTVTSHSGYLTAGYSLRPFEQLCCGVALKGMYDNLIDYAGLGGCADIGVLYHPWRWLGIGLAGRNLGPGIWYDSQRYGLPITIGLGLSYRHRKFRVLFDANAPIDNRFDYHLGAEYDINRFITVRAGTKLGPQDFKTLDWTSMVTAGCGLHYDRFALDYALVPYGQLGLTHRVALRINLHAKLYGRVRIHVREYQTGTPLTAQLTPDWVHQGVNQTDEEGVFVLEDVEPGWLQVTAQTDNHLPASDSVLVEARRIVDLRFVLRKSGFGSLWCAAHDAQTRKALEAIVEYSGVVAGSLRTDPTEGSFILRKIPAGEYELTLRPVERGYGEQTATVTVDPDQLTSHTFLIEWRATAPESLESSSATGDAETEGIIAPTDGAPAEPTGNEAHEETPESFEPEDPSEPTGDDVEPEPEPVGDDEQ